MVTDRSDDFRIPLERESGTWRLIVGGALMTLFALMIVRAPAEHAHGNPNEGAGLFLIVFFPISCALLISGVGIRRGWKPDLLFRLLPVIVVAVLVGLGICLA